MKEPEGRSTARQLKATLVSRMQLQDSKLTQEGLLQAVKLCDRFLNARASTPAELAVLKEEVRKALVEPQSVRMQAKATRAKLASLQQARQLSSLDASTSDAAPSRDPIHQTSNQRRASTASIHYTMAPLILEHKAFLAGNDFTRMTLQQDEVARQDQRAWQAVQRQRMQHTRAVLDQQMTEVHAAREAERQRKIREAQELDASIIQFQKDEMARMRQERQTQANQMAEYRAQQAEAAAAKAAEVERAAREAAIQRAEMEAAEARDRAAAAARAAEEKAKLERFQAEAKREVAAKAVREAERQERERQYNQEVMKEMDRKEAARIAQQEAWRAAQRAKYERAGGMALEQKVEDDAAAFEARTAAQAATYECKQSADAAARRAKEQDAARRTVASLKMQMAEHEAQREQERQAKEHERVLAKQEADARAAVDKAGKAARKAAQQALLLQQRDELQAWCRRKFNEVNAPMDEGDKWVHSKVLKGEDRAFNNTLSAMELRFKAKRK